MSIDASSSPEILDGLRLQIVREQVRRARAMTPSQRLAEAFSLTDAVFRRMHDGALQRLATADRERAWEEVRRQLERLRRLHDAGRFSSARPHLP
jgi:hypothetical protein